MRLWEDASICGEDINTHSISNKSSGNIQHDGSLCIAKEASNLADMEICATQAAKKPIKVERNTVLGHQAALPDSKGKSNRDQRKAGSLTRVARRLPESYISTGNRYVCYPISDDLYMRSREGSVIEMLGKLAEVYERQVKFLLFSISFVILSLVGIIAFYRTGFYIIHPTMYILTLLMGLGWTCTALGSIKNNKGVKACIKRN